MGIAQECYEPYWTNSGSYILWNRSCTTPPTSHFENHPNKTNKTCKTLLEKQGQTHKWCSLMDPFTQMCQCWPTNKNLPGQQFSMDRGCGQEDLLELIDEWQECVREIHASSVTCRDIYIYITVYGCHYLT